MERPAPTIVEVATKPIDGQKPGTSGLRKKTKVFETTPNYVENFVQSTFNAVGLEVLKGQTLVVGGDGRYFNKSMIQTIVRMAHANGLARVWVAENGILSTPAVSCVLRERENGVAVGAFILTASHNPGGPQNDVGIKFNCRGGGPAPEKLTDEIYNHTKRIEKYFISEMEPIDISTPGTITKFAGGAFTVEIISSTEDYLAMMKRLFDFSKLSGLLTSPDFKFTYDALSGVAGPYAVAVFEKELGAPSSSLVNCTPSEDFNGGHPDPNLQYAHDLVERMGLKSDGGLREGLSEADIASIPDFGAAADGDADRNMILGRRFFVTPSDSLAVLAARASCIPYFARNGGLQAVARSMPTSAAVDLVAAKLKIPFFEVPTGWKFFVNLCDAKALGKGSWANLLCGEESFGTSSSHIREKDGIFAALCWLSVLAAAREERKTVISVREIVESHWKEFGRNYYQRYDYEEVETEGANAMTARLTKLIGDVASGAAPRDIGEGYVIETCDEFAYSDSIDGSVSKNQGWRFLLKGGSRFVVRLSGTGSSGATVRIYLEQYVPPSSDSTTLTRPVSEALKTLTKVALEFCKVKEYLKRDAPTVIT